MLRTSGVDFVALASGDGADFRLGVARLTCLSQGPLSRTEL